MNNKTDLSKKTIFIVDDEPRVLSAIADSVRVLGSVVRAFSSANDCLAALEDGSCDLLVSDVNMPEMDGISLLSEVRRISPLMPIIIISGVGDIPMAVRAVREGAIDFVEKPLDESTFLPLIKTTLERTDSAPAVDLGSLTATERKVLQLVAEGKSNKEIAQIFDRSLRTIENHRHHLMTKLKTENVAGLVRIAVAAGLVHRR